MVVKFDWTDRHDRDLLCFCGLSVLQTLSTAVDNNVCGTMISCDNICPATGNDTSSCEISCLSCLLYGAMTHEIELQDAGMTQIVLVADGIGCNTIANYSRDICSVLFENGTRTEDGTQSAGGDVGEL